MGKYDDIINLPHHESDYHKRMPMLNRAAQFAPFAALSGHSEAIAETIRITESFKELTDDEKFRVSQKLLLAIENDCPIRISYFVPDKSKPGGSYKRIKGQVKKWDEYEKNLILTNGMIIPITFISAIELIGFSF